jgi:predicted MPP superfamily phosphohydrolase
MNRKKIKIKKRWFILVCLISILLAEMFYFSLRRFEVHIEEIIWDKTYEDLTDLRIVFISDLHYGFSMNEDKLNDIVMWVNRLDADIVLFGGDLFDHPATLLPSLSMQNTLSNGLSKMQAKIAKIAVLGNHDHESSLTSAMSIQVLQNGGFDVLVNQMQRLEIGQSAIQIVGIDSSILGSPNIERSLALVNADELVLVLTHTPDLVTRLPSFKVDWQLSGHSHGGQISLPWIGPIITPPDARLYTHGTYEVNGIRLDVTNGLGTTGIKARLFANPSIHLFILK